jgi:hypothetical protein
VSDTDSGDSMDIAPQWPDPVLREKVAHALSDHSDPNRVDYDHFRGYWLGSADAALEAAGLAEATAELDRLRTAHAILRIAVLNIADNDGAWLPGRVHWRAMARTALAADVTAMGDPEGYALDIERWAMRTPKTQEVPHA